MRLVVVLIAVASAFTGALLTRREAPLLIEPDGSDTALFV